MKNVERFYQVFVSSTYIDLKDERQAVMHTLLKMNCLPIGMELFPNGDPDVWKLITNLIDQCDLYILIVADRYGTISPEDEISYTEKEYLYALKRENSPEGRLPILIYPHNNPSNHNPDLARNENEERRDKLQKFRERIWNRATNPWTDIAELRTNIAIDLGNKLHKLEGGWAKQRYGAYEIFSDEIQQLEKRFESSEIKTLIKMLRMTLQEFHFGHSKHRLLQLAEMLPWLSPREWKVLSAFARAQVKVRSDWHLIDPMMEPLAEPMRQATIDMVNHYEHQLNNFERNILEVEGKLLIDNVSGYFILAVQREFLALSNEDFEFWDSPESKTYYGYNLRLMEREKEEEKVRIQRVFIATPRKFKAPIAQKVIKQQITDGIKVTIVFTEVVEDIIGEPLDRDFALHDDFAVSFFRNRYGRSYLVDSNHETSIKFRSLFYQVVAGSVTVPNKTGENKRIFELVSEFEEWVQQLTREDDGEGSTSDSSEVESTGQA